MKSMVIEKPGKLVLKEGEIPVRKRGSFAETVVRRNLRK